MTCRAKRAQAKRPERGGIIVEFALVLPIMILLVAGVMEIGSAWRDKSTTIQASRQAARAGAQLGQNPQADQAALLSALSVLPGGGSLSANVQVRRIVIYNSKGITAAELDGCKTALGNGTAGVCNIYSANNGRLNQTAIADNTNFDDLAGAWDAAWPASGRDQTPGSPDEFGVYVEVYRPYLTDVFPGDGHDVTAFTVMLVEPAD